MHGCLSFLALIALSDDNLGIIVRNGQHGGTWEEERGEIERSD